MDYSTQLHKYAFFCHKTEDPDSFNCLFCYCPLNALGRRCGGNFTYTENGIKNCENCMLPPSQGGYDYIISKYPEIKKLAAEN